MSTDSQIPITSVTNSTRPPQDNWIATLYRLQVWIYLILGALVLAYLVLLSLEHFVSGGGYDSLSFFFLLVIGIPFGLALLIPNVLALKDKSPKGWWLHVLSILVLGLVILSTINGNGLWGGNQALFVPITGGYLVSFIIALAAKQTLFGGVGVVVPLLAVSFIGLIAFAILSPTAPAKKQPAIWTIAELKPTDTVKGSVAFANILPADSGKLSPYSSQDLIGYKKIELPPLASKEYYDKLLYPGDEGVPLELNDSEYYQVWLANTVRTTYYPVLKIQIINGEVHNNSFGGGGYIANHDALPENLKSSDFPVVILSIETLSITEMNAAAAQSLSEYKTGTSTTSGPTRDLGRKQTEPTHVIFEGVFSKVNEATQSLFNEIVPDWVRADTVQS